MRLIALNGFAYPIGKWLSPGVETPFRFNWTQRNTNRLSRTITTPTIIVGFSDGATAACQIAFTNPNIFEAHIHSPEAYIGPIDYVPSKVRFYRTIGDATPTFEGARLTKERVGKTSVLVDLPFVRFPRRRTLVELWMSRNRHIFHNCLDRLPAGFVR